MNGLELVTATFARQNRRASFMPYFPVGYPDYATSLDILAGLAGAGADALEIGMPFSDPIADGPTLQAASQVALHNGITIVDCLRAVQELRTRGVTIPLLMMGYYNPILAYDEARFVQAAVEAGASGFIVPDLPPDESAGFSALTQQAGVAFPQFVAPTSSPERIQLAGERARGFIYLVSVTGVTGARTALSADLASLISRVQQITRQPVVVGFGISTPEKAREVGALADGVIIGSKLVSLAAEGPDAVVTFARQVRQALDA
ncbi:MAG: tryptophan synthase subunit alpha [Anaerolineae bacterium]|nr:tryptophan synthase subunit alpha [Anaerolineae bacterium]